jgi:hypothetical protein
MYSGSTLTSFSGRLLGAHQKIDRVAWRHLMLLEPLCTFPKIRSILHFEGGNGPDAIKRKSPAKDEPWHFLQPYNNEDMQLIELLVGHYEGLVAALRGGNMVRASFEAAWLAHGIVDGLTPAHHFPYEEKLVELRNGRSITSRTTLKKKLLMPGDDRTHQVSNNWKMWGPKGLFTTHAAFECGVATLIAPLTLRQGLPTQEQLQAFRTQGLTGWYRMQAQAIANWELYDTFYISGWTTSLARKVRSELAPALVRTVTIAWYAAVQEAAQNAPKGK